MEFSPEIKNFCGVWANLRDTSCLRAPSVCGHGTAASRRSLQHAPRGRSLAQTPILPHKNLPGKKIPANNAKHHAAQAIPFFSGTEISVPQNGGMGAFGPHIGHIGPLPGHPVSEPAVPAGASGSSGGKKPSPNTSLVSQIITRARASTAWAAVRTRATSALPQAHSTISSGLPE